MVIFHYRCPHCLSEREEDNYRSHCGRQLKETCPECGRMEWIGRPVCMQIVERIRADLQDRLNAEWRNAPEAGLLSRIVKNIFFCAGPRKDDLRNRAVDQERERFKNERPEEYAILMRQGAWESANINLK